MKPLPSGPGLAAAGGDVTEGFRVGASNEPYERFSVERTLRVSVVAVASDRFRSM
jgi:hypothetical protein